MNVSGGTTETIKVLDRQCHTYRRVLSSVCQTHVAKERLRGKSTAQGLSPVAVQKEGQILPGRNSCFFFGR